jgi:energy-coupling factor transporter ATP-binding protein EcfA2
MGRSFRDAGCGLQLAGLLSSFVEVDTKTYLGFGIRISSPFPLRDLPEVTGSPDVVVRPGNVPDSLVDSLLGRAKCFENPSARFKFSQRAIYFDWDRVGKVLVHDGNEIIVQTDAEASMEDLSPFLTGPVLAALLHQRQYFVLHASCIAVDGAAIVFVGPKGYGKSTLAAHMKVLGHRIISDDIVPLTLRSGEILVVPGFPRIKLYDDSIEAIGATPTDFPTIHRFALKRSLNLTETSEQLSTPLRAIYILSETDEFGIFEMSGAEAFIEILKNAHLGRFLVETGRQSSYFQLCREITNNVRVFRLDRPSSFEEMPAVLAALERHVEELAGNMRPPE